MRTKYFIPALLAFTSLAAVPDVVASAGNVVLMPAESAAPSSRDTSDNKANPDDLVADSTIKAVTVYADRAKVTREAIVDVPAGGHTVVFHGLPANLVTDSLRAEGSAIAIVKFGAVTQKIVTSTELVAPREKELNDQIEALEDQRITLEKMKEALEKKKDFIESLGQQAHLRTDENIAQIDLKPDQWTAAAQAIYSNVNDILTTETQQDIKIRAIDRQIEKARQDISGLHTGRKSTYDVIVPLDAESATKLTIDLSYQVPDATWRPIYDARLDIKSEHLELTEYGAVRQKTGEDWKDAALTLSTAQPERGASQPDLNPFWVDAYQQQTFSGYYAPDMRSVAPGTEGVSQTYAKAVEEENRHRVEEAVKYGVSALPVPISAPKGMISSGEDEPREAAFVPAQIETGGFTSEYKITGPATVMSDNTESKLMVGAFDTDSKIQIQIKPQLGSEAYLVAKTKLKGDSPILPGQVNLFRDGAFVGQDMMPLLRPGEEHGMYFGIDDQVAVKRKVLKDEKSEAGIISKDNVLERDFVTELQNLHSKPVEVVVRETSPVGRTDRITVDVVGDATTPNYKTDVDNIKGQLEWTIPMAAKEKKDLKLGWKVSWPKDMTLSGL